MPIGITKEGRWWSRAAPNACLRASLPRAGTMRAGDPETGAPAALLPRAKASSSLRCRAELDPAAERARSGALRVSDSSDAERGAEALPLDVIFPVSTAPSAKMAPFRGCWSLRASRTLARRTRLGYWDGQRRDEAAFCRRPSLPIMKHVTFLRHDWKRISEENDRRRSRRAQISVLRQTRQPRFIGRNQQGPRQEGIGSRP